MSKFTVDNSECALHIKTDHCTPIEVLKKLSSKQHSSGEEIVNELKEKTNCDTEFCAIKHSHCSVIFLNDTSI